MKSIRIVISAIVAGTACSLALSSAAVAQYAYEVEAMPLLVTSDVAGSHTTSAGVPVFGIDHDGVGDLIINRGAAGTFRCTATLLEQGDRTYALTAAHCLTDDFGVMDTVTADLTFSTTGGAVVAAASNFHVHPGYNGEVLNGFDVAVIEFASAVSSSVPSYQLFRGTNQREIGATHVKIGYGSSGVGSGGVTLPSGVKRAGQNEWESLGLGARGVGGITNNDTQVTFDFDSGAVGADAFNFFFGDAVDLGFGADEVNSAPGDSGGPTFIDDGGTNRIAAVTSYGLRLAFGGGTTSDVDGTLNSSWGEFGGDARVADSSILAWIDSVTLPGGVALGGDANLDGVVDPLDFSILGAHFGGAGGWNDGDFSGEGTVGPEDFSILQGNFTGGSPEVLGNGLFAFQSTHGLSGSVPEPSALLCFSIATLSFAGLRRNQQRRVSRC